VLDLHPVAGVLTQRVGDQIQRALVLLHDLAIQARKVEPVEDVVLIDLGKVFLQVRSRSRNEVAG
jgi:hypothetical protein